MSWQCHMSTMFSKSGLIIKLVSSGKMFNHPSQGVLCNFGISTQTTTCCSLCLWVVYGFVLLCFYPPLFLGCRLCWSFAIWVVNFVLGISHSILRTFWNHFQVHGLLSKAFLPSPNAGSTTQVKQHAVWVFTLCNVLSKYTRKVWGL